MLVIATRPTSSPHSQLSIPPQSQKSSEKNACKNKKAGKFLEKKFNKHHKTLWRINTRKVGKCLPRDFSELFNFGLSESFLSTLLCLFWNEFLRVDVEIKWNARISHNQILSELVGLTVFVSVHVCESVCVYVSVGCWKMKCNSLKSNLKDSAEFVPSKSKMNQMQMAISKQNPCWNQTNTFIVVVIKLLDEKTRHNETHAVSERSWNESYSSHSVDILSLSLSLSFSQAHTHHHWHHNAK